MRNYDKRQIAHQFSRAASTYDSVSQLQGKMADRLINQITFKNETDRFVLIDLGCGTGESLEKIGFRFQSNDAGLPGRGQSLSASCHLPSPDPDHHRDSGRSVLKRIGIDIAAGMIEQAARRLVAEQDVQLLVADLEQTGLESGIADLVFCNAVLQWCDSMTALTEVFRLLKPEGKLLAATFGPETLAELKQAWQKGVDLTPSIHLFASADQVESDLKRVGFDLVRVTSERVMLNYPSSQELLYSLKRLGATHAHVDRRQGLWGKESFLKLCDQLQRQLTGSRGIEVTFEVLYLEGTRPQ